MPRIRSIHPGLATDEAFMQMTAFAKAAWSLLWTQCDDQGVFEWKPVVLKARILPADHIEFASILEEWESLGCVQRFEVDGKSFGAVRNFQRWQRPKKPNPVYPLPNECRKFVGISEPSGEEVPNQYGTGGEKSAQREEVGGRREEESSRRGAEAPAEGRTESSKTADLGALIYAQGRRVLGKSGGGLVTKLREHFSDDIVKVDEVLAKAADTANQEEARAYVAGVLRKPKPDDFDPLKPKFTDDELYPPELYRGLR